MVQALQKIQSPAVAALPPTSLDPKVLNFLDNLARLMAKRWLQDKIEYRDKPVVSAGSSVSQRTTDKTA